MSITLKINGLHPKQREIASQIIASDAKFHTICSSRQFGKSTLLTYLIPVLAHLQADEEILIVSPSYSQSELLFSRLLSIKGVESTIIKKKSSKPYQITFSSGTTVHFKSADRPDSLRGGSYIAVVIDEMAFVKEGVFETIIRPTTAAKPGSKIISSSTPKGKFNSFSELYHLGLDPENTKYDSYFATYADNPYYDTAEVVDARARLPVDIFKQEYEGVFIDGGGNVFDNFSEVATIERFKPYVAGRYFAGLDFGKVSDATVLTILNTQREVVFMQEYKGLWTKQQSDIAAILRAYKPITYAESNGPGDSIIDNLSVQYSNITPFVTSNSSKREIIEALRMDIQLGKISLPSIKLKPELSKEMSEYTYSITKSGLITYHHPNGGHDDYVDSLSIANYAFNKNNVGFKVVSGRRSNFFDN